MAANTLFKRGDGPHGRHHVASALFGRGARDVSEARKALFEAVAREARDAALRRREDDFSDARFDRLLDDPVRFFRCDKALQERHGKRRFGRAVGAGLELHPGRVAREADGASPRGARAVEELNFFARGKPQRAAGMTGGLRRKLERFSEMELISGGVDEEARRRHVALGAI